MKFPLYMRIIATLACLIIFTIGVCGNLLVPLVVIKTKYLRNSTNLFLINLSVADLLVLIVCMPTVLIELHSRPETWLLGEAMCKYHSLKLGPVEKRRVFSSSPLKWVQLNFRLSGALPLSLSLSLISRRAATRQPQIKSNG